VSRRCVYSDGVRCDEFTPNEHRAKDDLKIDSKKLIVSQVSGVIFGYNHMIFGSLADMFSKKFSPTMMTESPPLVHPSDGEMALMHGVAIGIGGYIPRIF
jgi:hypothetical protein